MFFNPAEIKRIDDNSLRQVLAYGDGLMNARVIFEKGLAPETEITFHHHSQVQTTYVLKGAFKFAIKSPDGSVTTQVVRVGDSVYFSSNYEHGCIPLEDASELIDSFTPIRQDFLDFKGN